MFGHKEKSRYGETNFADTLVAIKNEEKVFVERPAQEKDFGLGNTRPAVIVVDKNKAQENGWQALTAKEVIGYSTNGTMMPPFVLKLAKAMSKSN